MSNFNRAAKSYDADFTSSPIGKMQRSIIWNLLKPRIKGKQLHVLELNGGTGEDACILAREGHRVLLTDASVEMLNVARQKLEDNNLSDSVKVQQIDLMDAAQLKTLTDRYDMVFSNFAGLNCLPPEALKNTLSACHELVNEGGEIVLVFLGRFCLWETFYFLMKGKRSDAFRRTNKEVVYAQVEGEQVPTWYYAPKEIAKLAEGKFVVEQINAVGTAVPPSYLNPWFTNKKVILKALYNLDKTIGKQKAFAQLSDHYLIRLKKV